MCDVWCRVDARVVCQNSCSVVHCLHSPSFFVVLQSIELYVNFMFISNARAVCQSSCRVVHNWYSPSIFFAIYLDVCQSSCEMLELYVRINVRCQSCMSDPCWFQMPELHVRVHAEPNSWHSPSILFTFYRCVCQSWCEMPELYVCEMPELYVRVYVRCQSFEIALVMCAHEQAQGWQILTRLAMNTMRMLKREKADASVTTNDLLCIFQEHITQDDLKWAYKTGCLFSHSEQVSWRLVDSSSHVHLQASCKAVYNS